MRFFSTGGDNKGLNYTWVPIQKVQLINKNTLFSSKLGTHIQKEIETQIIINYNALTLEKICVDWVLMKILVIGTMADVITSKANKERKTTLLCIIPKLNVKYLYLQFVLAS